MIKLITASIRVCCAGAIFVLAGNVSAHPGHTLNEWDHDHGDISIGFENGELDIHVHFEDGLNGIGPEIEYHTDEIYIRVGDSAKVEPTEAVPYLGTGPGEPIWVLPQSGTMADALGLPYVGIATDDLDDSVFTSVDLRMTGYLGPGDVAVWQSDGLSDNVFFQTSDLVGPDDLMQLPIGIHDHNNFGFTKRGVYQVALKATGYLATGESLDDYAIVTFVVGSSTAVPEPGSMTLLASMGVVGMLGRRRRRS